VDLLLSALLSPRQCGPPKQRGLKLIEIAADCQGSRLVHDLVD
jgi:hypothetical protein